MRYVIAVVKACPGRVGGLSVHRNISLDVDEAFNRFADDMRHTRVQVGDVRPDGLLTIRRDVTFYDRIDTITDDEHRSDEWRRVRRLDNPSDTTVLDARRVP